jgi:hypothetical protein
MTNSRKRDGILAKTNKIDFKCEWGMISHWEIFDEKTREYYRSKIPRIGMKDKTQWKPRFVIQEALD